MRETHKGDFMNKHEFFDIDITNATFDAVWTNPANEQVFELQTNNGYIPCHKVNGSIILNGSIFFGNDIKVSLFSEKGDSFSKNFANKKEAHEFVNYIKNNPSEIHSILNMMYIDD